MRTTLLLGLGLVLMACATAQETDAWVIPEKSASGSVLGKDDSLIEKIVNGQIEQGFPSVGALVINGGGLCTGTVIADRWVLTAAHCFDDGFNTGTFILGTDARSGQSRRVQMSAAICHPNYDARTNRHDIALVKLADPAGTTPMAMVANLNVAPGEVFKWVGFGRTDGRQNRGEAGVKRSVELKITALTDTQIRSDEAGRNACRGDSGGPAFKMLNGLPLLAGVTSFGDRACQRLTVNTRVDVHQAFLREVMDQGALYPCGVNSTVQSQSDTAPSSQPDPTPPVAGGTLDCSGLLQCTSGCEDDLCTQACAANAKSEAINVYNRLMGCAQQMACHDWACVESRCTHQANECVGGDITQSQPQSPSAAPSSPAARRGGTCQQLAGCIQGCQGAAACIDQCEGNATASARTAYNQLAECAWELGCQDSACVQDNCGLEMQRCADPSEAGEAQVDPATQGQDVITDGGQSALGGQLTCSEIFVCFQNCGPNHQACYTDCYNRGQFVAQAQLDGVETCMVQMGCNDMSCVENRCNRELNACLGG